MRCQRQALAPALLPRWLQQGWRPAWLLRVWLQQAWQVPWPRQVWPQAWQPIWQLQVWRQVYPRRPWQVRVWLQASQRASQRHGLQAWQQQVWPRWLAWLEPWLLPL